MFTKEDIRGARNEPQRVELEINGKKDFIFARGMSGAERDSWEAEQFEARRKGDTKTQKLYRASQYVRMACDENGKLLFTPEDAAWVKDLPCCVLEPVIDVGQRLSGMSAAAAEDIGKNLTGDLSDSST